MRVLNPVNRWKRSSIGDGSEDTRFFLVFFDFDGYTLRPLTVDVYIFVPPTVDGYQEDIFY